MKPIIKSFHCSNIDDLYSYKPKDLEDFSFLLELSVGLQEEEGSDLFNIQICTPKWFMSSFRKDEIVFLRNFILVFEYNFPRIFEKIKGKIETVSGESWQEIAQKVSRIGFWEYEDYIG